MEDWERFVEDVQVFRLLESLSGAGQEDPATETGADVVTRYGARALADAVWSDAVTLGIAIDSLAVEVRVTPVAELPAPGSPWLRYTVSIEAPASPAEIGRLHELLEMTVVQRIMAELDVSIAGRIVNTRVPAFP
jgi:hypothetical protein